MQMDTDETGFSGLAGGYRDFKAFYNLGEAAMFWTASDYKETLGWSFFFVIRVVQVLYKQPTATINMVVMCVVLKINLV